MTALRDRKPHEGAKTGTDDLPSVGGVGGIDNHLEILVGGDRLSPPAAAQEIDRGVVRDAEEPALRVVHRGVVGFDCLDDGILNGVLAVDDRPGHAGAIAVELGRRSPKSRSKAARASPSAAIGVVILPTDS